jgi:hypothetical protein
LSSIPDEFATLAEAVAVDSEDSGSIEVDDERDTQ